MRLTKVQIYRFLQEEAQQPKDNSDRNVIVYLLLAVGIFLLLFLALFFFLRHQLLKQKATISKEEMVRTMRLLYKMNEKEEQIHQTMGTVEELTQNQGRRNQVNPLALQNENILVDGMNQDPNFNPFIEQNAKAKEQFALQVTDPNKVVIRKVNMGLGVPKIMDKKTKKKHKIPRKNQD